MGGAPLLASQRFPAMSWKTCLDTIPIHEDNQKHTTFLNPWGTYEHQVTPQGHLAAGDGYFHSYGEITREFTSYKRCVNDTC